MRCPSCEVESPASDFGDPPRCPHCGLFYEKAMAFRAARKNAPPRPSRYSKPQRKRLAWPFFVIPAVALISTVMAVRNAPEPVEHKATTPAPVASQPAAPATAEQASLVDQVLPSVRLEWKGVLDGQLLTLNFTLINESDRAVKDFEIRCVHRGASGTEIDSNTRTVYDLVPARSRKTFSGFSMGVIHSQTAHTECAVTDLKT